MDHPCHKCGQSIEDGKAFCSSCGAPQIRVAVAEPPEVSKPDTFSGEEPIFALDPPEGRNPLTIAALSAGIQWPRAFRICGVAAFISIVVASLRLMPPPVAMLGAGCLAVILYYRRSPGWRVDARSGAQLGALTSLLSYAVFALCFLIFLAILQSGGAARQQLIEALQQVGARSHDPQVQAFLDLLNSPDGLAAKLVVGMVGFLLISLAAGSVAGALTGAFLGRRHRP
jgi:hypothetical protein